MVYFDAIRTPERGATGAAARPPSVSPVVAAKEASIDKDRCLGREEFFMAGMALPATFSRTHAHRRACGGRAAAARPPPS